MREIILLMLVMLISCRDWVEQKEIRYRYVNHDWIRDGEVKKVWVDKEFERWEISGIRAAISEWNMALNGWKILEIEREDFDMDRLEEIKGKGGYIIMKKSGEDIGEKLMMGYVNRIGGDEIYIKTRNVERVGGDIYTVMMHELGHIMGARHREGGGLMTGEYNKVRYRCIDKWTIEEIGGKWKERMNYCIWE